MKIGILLCVPITCQNVFMHHIRDYYCKYEMKIHFYSRLACFDLLLQMNDLDFRSLGSRLTKADSYFILNVHFATCLSWFTQSHMRFLFCQQIYCPIHSVFGVSADCSNCLTSQTDFFLFSCVYKLVLFPLRPDLGICFAIQHIFMIFQLGMGKMKNIYGKPSKGHKYVFVKAKDKPYIHYSKCGGKRLYGFSKRQNFIF